MCSINLPDLSNLCTSYNNTSSIPLHLSWPAYFTYNKMFSLSSHTSASLSFTSQFHTRNNMVWIPSSIFASDPPSFSTAVFKILFLIPFSICASFDLPGISKSPKITRSGSFHSSMLLCQPHPQNTVLDPFLYLFLTLFLHHLYLPPKFFTIYHLILPEKRYFRPLLPPKLFQQHPNFWGRGKSHAGLRF